MDTEMLKSKSANCNSMIQEKGNDRNFWHWLLNLERHLAWVNLSALLALLIPPSFFYSSPQGRQLALSAGFFLGELCSPHALLDICTTLLQLVPSPPHIHSMQPAATWHTSLAFLSPAIQRTLHLPEHWPARCLVPWTLPCICFAQLQCDHSCDPQRCLTLFLCAACLLHTAAWLQQNLPEMEIVPVRRGNCKYTDRGQTLPSHLLTHINPGELRSFSPFCICANHQGSACTTVTPPAVAEILSPLSQPCSTLGIRKELRQCPLRDPSSCSRVLSMPFTLSRQRSQPNSPIPQLCPLLRLEITAQTHTALLAIQGNT